MNRVSRAILALAERLSALADRFCPYLHFIFAEFFGYQIKSCIRVERVEGAAGKRLGDGLVTSD